MISRQETNPAAGVGARYDEQHECETVKLDRIFPAVRDDGDREAGCGRPKPAATRYRKWITRRRIND